MSPMRTRFAAAIAAQRAKVDQVAKLLGIPRKVQ